MQRLKKTVRVGAAVLLAGCVADSSSPLAPAGDPAQVISDAAHAGEVPGFYFLPPMVPQPAYSGTFDAGVSPQVEVCELTGSSCAAVIAVWTMSSGVSVSPSSQQYQVNWHTNQYALDPAKHYRISVFVGSFRLGFADVDVVASGKELKNVNTGEYIALLDGRTLPIKFRIETGIVAQVVVSPDSADIPIGDTQQFTATLLDLHGDPIVGPTVAWSSSDEGVATIDQTGLATGVSPGASTITASAQAASGTAVLTVFNPNQPPVAEPDTFDAIGNFTVPVSAPGVLANDSDPDANPLSAVPGTFPTAQGGTFTLAADGSFTYLSAAGFTGTDEVAYEITDGIATAQSTVTFVVPTRVWYVANDGAAPGDGRDASPFTALKSAEAASLAGETIFVLAGDGTSAGLDEGIVLKNAQSLTGQGVPANVTASLNGETVVLLAAGSAPSLTRADAGTTVALALNNTVQGVEVASTAGAGIAGAGFGTLTAGSVSVAAVGGPSLDLSNGTAAASFGALSSAGSAGAGLRLVNVGGVLSAPAGSISGAAGTGIEVAGGDAAATYGGNVASVGPRPVSVTGRTGGTLTLSGTIASTGHGILVQGNGGGTIAFTGASKSLSTGANHGVELASNGGATVQFAGGGLAVATTAGDGFRATGGGTVTVTGAGNTLVSAGGTALRVENATIGGAGLTFRSVSATGGPNGIVLANTGAVNGVQVTGTGAAGSGGTIQGSTGPDGSTSGIGVYLSAARNVSFQAMVVAGASNFAIRGVDVNGFSLRDSEVSGTNGDNPALDEGSVSFIDLVGTALVSATSVSGGAKDNLRVSNSGGSLALTIDGATFGLNGVLGGGDGVSLEAHGSAVLNVSVQGSNFTAARTHLLRLHVLGTAQSHAILDGNTFSNTHPAIVSGAGGVVLESGVGTPTLSYLITDNSFRDAVGSALVVSEGAGSGTVSGTISGNTIGASGVANSGSTQGSSLGLISIGAGSHTTLVHGNRLQQYNNHGVLLQIGDATLGGDGALNATLIGNIIAEPGTAAGAKNGIHLNAGLDTDDNPQVCLDVGGVGALANALVGSGSGGAAGTDFRLRQRFLTTVRLPGYVGGNADNAAVTAFIQGRNTGVPTGLAQNTVATGGGGFVGGAACPQP